MTGSKHQKDNNNENDNNNDNNDNDNGKLKRTTEITTTLCRQGREDVTIITQYNVVA